VFDLLTPGLALRISHTGRRVWTLFYRFDRKQHRLSLGRYPAVDLRRARELAREALTQVELGNNPAVARQEDQQRTAEGVYLYENVAAAFIEQHARPKNRTWQEQQRVLEVNAAPRWTGRDIRTLNRADIRQLLRDVEQRTSTARSIRVLATVKRLFSWAVEQDLLEQSPAADVVAARTQMPRRRLLDADEIRAVWEACEALGDPFGRAVQVLLLTGQRRGEVTSMRLQDVDIAEASWLIPGDMTKNGRPHFVPLSQKALEIITERRRWDGVPYVFSAGRTGSRGFLQGWSRFKSRLDEASGVTDWRIHDLRRTVGSNLGRWVGYEIVGAVLNHSRSGLMGVTATYNLYQYADEKRIALERWANYLAGLVASEPEGVV